MQQIQLFSVAFQAYMQVDSSFFNPKVLIKVTFIVVELTLMLVRLCVCIYVPPHYFTMKEQQQTTDHAVSQ